MAVSFSRYGSGNNLQGQGGTVMLIRGTVTVTSSASAITASDLGVNKVLAFLGSCSDASAYTYHPLVANDGTITLGSTTVNTAASTWPVGVYADVAFLAT